MLKMAPSLFSEPPLLMRRWFSGGDRGKGHIISAFVQQTSSFKTFKTRGRDDQVPVPGCWAPSGPAWGGQEGDSAVPNPS